MRHDIVLVKKWLRAGVVSGVGGMSACATASNVLVGQIRAPISPREVNVFLEPVRGPFERIAVIDASSRLSMSLTAEGRAEVVISRLKAEAAKLGANGLVLEEISDGDAAAVGAGLAPDVSRDHASLGVGLSATGLFASRHGRGVAIYIAPHDAAR